MIWYYVKLSIRTFERPSEYTIGVYGYSRFSCSSISDIVAFGMKHLVYHNTKLGSTLRKNISNKISQIKCLVFGLILNKQLNLVRYNTYFYLSPNSVQVVLYVKYLFHKYFPIEILTRYENNYRT